MTPPNTNVLDHLVHLTPPGTVPQASDQFRQLGFTVLPGGTHADGMTANALVVLSDSVYVELISFVHPIEYYPPGSAERRTRENHFWANKSPGWIDYAFLGNGSLEAGRRISDAINGRAGHQIYTPESSGGRRQPDGRELKWLFSFVPEDVRGTLPFFCGDVTPREWRVPSDPGHPSSAYGIAYIKILTSAESYDKIKNDLTAVVGDSPTVSPSSVNEASWKLETSRTPEERPELILSIAKNAEEKEFLTQSGTGIHEVAFRVRDKKNGSEHTPYGKIRWIPDHQSF